MSIELQRKEEHRKGKKRVKEGGVCDEKAVR